MVARIRDIVLDVAAGFCTLLVLLVFIGVFHTVRLHFFLPLAAALFFGASFARGIWSETNPWIEAVLVTVGGWLPFAIAARMILHAGAPELGGMGLLLALICFAGAQSQSFWKGNDRLASGATALLLAGFLLVVGQFSDSWMATSAGFHSTDRPAPAFTLTTLEGSPITLQSLKGRVVVLDFWGTWCTPCIAEMPALIQVHREFESNRDVVFLAVDSGWNNDTPDRIRRTVAEKHFDLPVVLDTTGVARQMQVSSLPTLMLLDRNGHIRKVDSSGYDSSEPLGGELAGQIRQLLSAN